MLSMFILTTQHDDSIMRKLGRSCLQVNKLRANMDRYFRSYKFNFVWNAFEDRFKPSRHSIFRTDFDSLRRTTDFGVTWRAISTNTFRSPCDFSVEYGNSNIMYCGDGVTGSGNGIFWKSTDNGYNWSQIHTVTGSEIR